MNYFPLLLFVPGLLVLWAAIVAEQPEAKGSFLKAVVMFLAGIAFVLTYFWPPH
jgi:hypothetical protein